MFTIGTILAMAAKAEEKKNVVETHRRHEKDTGSPEVQIALLTDRINHLTEHLKRHKKDHTTRRGLRILVGRRKTLRKYLAKKSNERYEKLIEKLGLRK